MQHDFPGHVLPLGHQHHMIPMDLSMAHDTDTRTTASTGTKSHIITLNNHLNNINAILSLIAPSASCDRKHVIVMNVPKANRAVKSHI